jgi:hypothetical protein
MDETGPDPLKDLEKALEQWGHRGPKTPPEVGARRVLDRLPESRDTSSFPWSRFLLPAAALLVLALGYTILMRDGRPPAEVAGEIPAPPIVLDENTALIWLDEETPLYLTLAAPESHGDKP